MRGVEAKSVEVILLQPMADIGPHILTDGRCIRPIQIEPSSPCGLVLREICLAELRQDVSDRSKVVVHDVQNHPEAVRVRRIDESSRVVRLAVTVKRREEQDARGAPTEQACEAPRRADSPEW